VSTVNTVEIADGQGDVIGIVIRRCGNSSVDLHAWGLFALAAAISRKALKNFDFTVLPSLRSSIVIAARATRLAF